MKMKWVWIAVAVVILLGAALYGYHKLSARMTAPVAMKQTNNAGVFASIQGALSGNLSLMCQFTADDGSPTTAYIKMGAVHVDTNIGKPAAASFIMKDKKIYFWQLTSKTGTMMTVPDITITPGSSNSAGQPTGAQNTGATMLATLEKFKNSCKTAVVADSLFTPPADVTFTDMSEMMHTIPVSGVPSGAVGNGAMNQQDVQKMMQQYQKTAPTGY